MKQGGFKGFKIVENGMWKMEKQAPSFHLPLATFHCFPPFPA